MYDTTTNPPVATGDGTGALWPENATMDELREIIRRLNNDLTEVKAQSEARLQRIQQTEDRHTQQMGKYRNDMKHWETVLRGQKEERGWCDEGTNEVIDALNAGFIGGWEIEPYETEFDLEVEITGTMKATTTVTISASSEEKAREMFDEDPYSYIDADDLLTDAARNVSFDDVEIDLQ